MAQPPAASVAVLVVYERGEERVGEQHATNAGAQHDRRAAWPVQLGAQRPQHPRRAEINENHACGDRDDLVGVEQAEYGSAGRERCGPR